MHRQSHEEVAAAARRRLELLGRELDQAGLRRVEEPAERPDHAPAAGADAPVMPPPAPVPAAGRHARPPRPGPGRRLTGWLGDQVPDTLRGRAGLEPATLMVVVVVVAVALASTAYVVFRMGGGDPAAVPVAVAPSTSASPLVPAPSQGASAAPGASAASGTPAAGGQVTVDVAGKVRRPGVTTLPAGSRVVDALEKAGGPRGRVDLTSLNLARVLVDGEQILVGRASGPPGGLAAGASTAAPDPAGSLVNINTATAEQLETLPGVGPVTAGKILDWRAAHGAFAAVDELLEIDGIGEKTLAELAPHVTL